MAAAKSRRKLKLKLALALGLVALLAIALVGARWVIRRARSMNIMSAPAAVATVRVATPLEPAEVLYDGKLGDGWQDWGWGPHKLGGGPAQVVFQGYGGILFHHPPLSQAYGGVAFRFKAPEEWGEFLHVSLRSTGAPDTEFPIVSLEPRHVLRLDAEWHEALVDWKELNPKGLSIDRVMIGTGKSVGSDWVLLDKVMLTKSSTSGGAAPAQKDDTLRVLCDGESHPVSEQIYGNSAESWESGQYGIRSGGNPLSRYNWDLNAWNTGNDWFFENVPGPAPLSKTLESRIKQDHKTALVVPMLGWVAKDTTSFGFPRSKFPDQRKFDQYRPDAGEGVRPDGKPIDPGEPELTSIPAPPELIEKWVRGLVEADTARGKRAVEMYILDNEPSLWNATHRDVHPKPLTYDELLERTVKYAAAIRRADPQGVIAGPAEWGWPAYFYSALDREAGLQLQPDRRAHGGTPLIPWYLKKLADLEKASGQRLLDVLDLHFYPAADGLYGGNARTDADAAALRVRSTRAMWDPTYIDESWINESIALIPRMKTWVRENYPGLKLSIGEWNFGAEEHISGGLATAETLGRFGQQGLDAAYFWGDLKTGTPAYWAFRAFRNFDGKGGRFLDVSLPVRESADVSVFASRDAQKSKLVVVLINRAAATKVRASLAFQGCGGKGTARLFSYGPSSKGLSAAPFADTDVGISALLEPQSIYVLEVLSEKKP